MDTRAGDRTCSALLQSGRNSLYLESSGKASTSDQLGTTLVRFQISESKDNDNLESCIVKEVESPTPQMLSELSLSLQTANGDKCSETDTELNLNLCTDRQKSHNGENQISSWTNTETDGDGSLGFEESSLLHFKFQIQHKVSDPENSSMDSCLPPSPRLDKRSIPLSLIHYTERDDTSSTDDESSSPANSSESRFTSYDESSSSDSSLFSFLNDSSLSETNSKNADCRDSRNSMLTAEMRTGLMNKVTETDKTLCPLTANEPSVANLDTSSEVVVTDVLPNSFPETVKNNHVLSCRKSEIGSCLHSSVSQSPTSLSNFHSAAFYSKEPQTTDELFHVENAGCQMNTENSGEPLKWRLEKQYKWKQMKNDISFIHNMSHFDNPHKWQDDLWETRSHQPEFEQVL
ncbi:uncharacterized protein LOC125462147 isoform X2 [Stegostoma tigrinum]|uniref:uncharacterized protein LOC125462147 isoform X2 n=1 Tax=Stegostoma tigrinum TaxID=3053191 RepID=UPI00202B6EB2|nr:uncharacterized protein LOC125462147 isoform X2 [Stegostoma tigrinum]